MAEVMDTRSHIRALAIAAALACLASITLWAGAARAQRRGAGVQTLYGSETPVRRPVQLTRDVIRLILESDPDRGCQVNEAQAAADLVGSRIDINDDSAPDLVAQGTSGCFIGAHSTNFYVFSKAETRIAPGFDLVLFVPADYLQVMRRSTNGYRDIETGYHTALEMYSTVWKFDGQKYQPRECTVETFRTRKRARVPCER